jgi:adenosine deaminase
MSWAPGASAHGWPIGTDRALLDRLRDDQIVIEVCPSAALQVAGVGPASHPLAAWLDHGVPIVVGSDHPLAFATSVSGELALLERAEEAHGEPGRMRAAVRHGKRLLGGAHR